MIIRHIFILLLIWRPLFTQAQETTDDDFFSFMLDSIPLELRKSSADMGNLRQVIAENNAIILNGYMLGFLTESDIRNIHTVTASWLNAMEHSDRIEENKEAFWPLFRLMINQAKNTES